MTRLVLSSLRAIAIAGAAAWAASALAPPVTAATKPAKAAAKTEKKDDAAKPALVASFGDWNVFVGEAGKGRICYTLAQPKSRDPASLKRDPGYAFISDRPAEGVRNEVSFIMGFDVAGGADAAEAEARPEARREASVEVRRQIENAGRRPAPVALVDETSFEMLPKGGNLWVKNAAKERRAHHRDAQRREAGHQGRFAQRPPIDRHLFADRLRPGAGPAAEGMPGKVVSCDGALRQACRFNTVRRAEGLRPCRA